MKLDKFKQEIAKVYDRRQSVYDLGKSGNWHYDLACSLVEYADLRSGQKILDLATGTGMVALEAAKKVGSFGKVIGVDISSGLLAVARQKIDEAKLNSNITLQLADVETLNFARNSFDCILCCSAFPLFTNVPADLLLWHNFLVPEGKLGLCVFAETAFVHGVVLQKVARRYGIDLTMSDLTGTPAKCRSLLEAAGYRDIEITTKQYGSYITSESSASKSWDTSLQHPHCSPLLNLQPQKLEQAKAEYIDELETLNTERGIWNDITTYFVIAKK